jgi:aspartate racemase
MKTREVVGIIGGLGPDATAEMYLDLQDRARRANLSHRPNILISSVPLDFQEEEQCINGEQSTQILVPLLTSSAQDLERGGATFIVMACNTLHAHIQEIRASVSIPVISIIEETVRAIQLADIHSVGILSTEATLSQGLYTQGLSQANIVIHTPSASEQKEINKVINHLVQSKGQEGDYSVLQKASKNLENAGAEAIVFACTDFYGINLNLPKHILTIDTLSILAESSMNMLMQSLTVPTENTEQTIGDIPDFLPTFSSD